MAFTSSLSNEDRGISADRGSDFLVTRASSYTQIFWLSPLGMDGVCVQCQTLICSRRGTRMCGMGDREGCLAADALLPLFSEQLLVSGSLLVESEKRDNILLVRRSPAARLGGAKHLLLLL